MDTTASLLPSERSKYRQLTVAKRRATLVLVAVTALFVGVAVAGSEAAWSGYVQAAAEASMVGALADWFAVTALFRRPLGLPIPHTAIVVERKEQFGATLGEFIQNSFLTPQALAERARAAAVVPRAARWLAESANAARVAGFLADAAVAVADGLRDDDVHRAMEGMARERLEALPVAPLAGRGLRFLTAEGRHHEVVDAAARGLDRYLDEHREELRRRFRQPSPWWLPGAVEDRIFERLLEGARAVLQELVADRGHHLRRDLEERLEQLAEELEHSPRMREHGERLKRDLLGQPQLRAWIASLWSDAKVQLRTQAADPDSALRRRLALTVAAAGRRLSEDQALAGKLESGVEAAVTYVAGQFGGEISSLVSGTVARWDGHETSRRLELLLGPDLQYIRINGAIVGGAVGLGLHAVARALG